MLLNYHICRLVLSLLCVGDLVRLVLTTDVVIQQHSRKLLTMDILMSETCWAHKKWNKIASDIKLVFHSSTNIFISSAHSASLNCEEHVYIHTYLAVYRLCMNYRCYQITLRVKHIFTEIGSGAKCWLEVYDWGASLSLTGWKRDIGQNVLQASF